MKISADLALPAISRYPDLGLPYTQTSKQTSKQTGKQTSKQTNKQASKQTNKQVNKQTNKQVNNQTNKQISKQTSKETVVLRQWEYFKMIWFYQLGYSSFRF